MPARCEVRPFTGPLSVQLQKPAERDGTSLYWLGQAGFLIRGSGLTLLIDPYLSDSLAEKYRDTAMSHDRMMPAPIAIADLPPVDLVFSTHAHTDHLDPGTLQPLLSQQPQARLVCPRAKEAESMDRAAISADRVIAMDAGESLSPLPGLTLRAVRAAHETLERDQDGRYVFLGYGITLDGQTVFHSGDSIPYEGQTDEVRALGADLALLPVNGRSAALAEKNIPGNLHLAEAVVLTAEAGIPAMIAHHFDMFAFNTVPRATVEAAAVRPDLPIRLLPASVSVEYRLVA